jgi:hypothetical protein
MLAAGHMLNAIRETVPLAKTMDDQINRLRSWAAGRAWNASTARNAGPPEHIARKVEF